jgi:hypothetical protein
MERFYSEMHWRFLASGLIAAATLGCGNGKPSSEKPQGFPTERPSTDNLPTAENLNFKNWSQFPVGTTATWVKNTKNEKDWVKETTVRKLVEKSANTVVVEWQVTVERPNYETKVNSPNRTEIPATFRVPPSMTAQQLQAPSLKAKKAGEETVTILGKTYKAELFTWQDGTESGPMEVKAWYVDDLPGRIARQTMKVGQKDFDSLEEITSISIPKE